MGPVNWDEKFRSRKWLLSVGIQVFTTIGLLAGYLDGTNFERISQANLLAYSFGNAAEYFTQRGRT